MRTVTSRRASGAVESYAQPLTWLTPACSTNPVTAMVYMPRRCSSRMHDRARWAVNAKVTVRHRLGGRGRGDAVDQSFPKAFLGAGAAHRVRKRGSVGDLEEQAVLFVHDALAGSAHV